MVPPYTRFLLIPLLVVVLGPLALAKELVVESFDEKELHQTSLKYENNGVMSSEFELIQNGLQISAANGWDMASATTEVVLEEDFEVSVEIQPVTIAYSGGSFGIFVFGRFGPGDDNGLTAWVRNVDFSENKFELVLSYDAAEIAKSESPFVLTAEGGNFNPLVLKLRGNLGSDHKLEVTVSLTEADPRRPAFEGASLEASLSTEAIRPKETRLVGIRQLIPGDNALIVRYHQFKVQSLVREP